MARKKIIAGNWKMYKTIEEAVKFLQELTPKVSKTPSEVFLAVPYTAIHTLSKEAKSSNIVIGAQNMNDASEGAFTGEIAGRMLCEAGAEFVILGHSERRHIFNESNTFINRKLTRALEDGLKPILCIGETLEEREQGKTSEVLEKQLSESLSGLKKTDVKKVIIAYEPVWAIGTGKTATPEMAQEVHENCRKFIAEHWSDAVAKSIIIQYGGSVKPENVKALMEQEDIDGALVGGASLCPNSFSQIVNFHKETINV